MLFRFAFLLGIAFLTTLYSTAAQETITIFAAASLRNAIGDINAAFMNKTGIKTVTSFAATSALLKQIEQGAPADIFLSADVKWMDYGVEKKLMRDATRVNLLGNRLALIAPRDSKTRDVTIAKGFDIGSLAGDGHIVTADVNAVPAGRYAKAALQSLGVWNVAEKKIAMVENVRAALALVARGEAPIGIVYETDAKIDPGVKIIGRFPGGSHPPITYPAAATAGAKPAAAEYLAFLRTQTAKTIFEQYGFSFLIRPTS